MQDLVYLYTSKEYQNYSIGGTSEGFFDFGARAYNPVTARWNSFDPLGEMDYGGSPYMNVSNNPVVFYDPFGLKEENSNNNSDEDPPGHWSLWRFLRDLFNVNESDEVESGYEFDLYSFMDSLWENLGKNGGSHISIDSKSKKITIQKAGYGVYGFLYKGDSFANNYRADYYYGTWQADAPVAGIIELAYLLWMRLQPMVIFSRNNNNREVIDNLYIFKDWNNSQPNDTMIHPVMIDSLLITDQNGKKYIVTDTLFLIEQ